MIQTRGTRGRSLLAFGAMTLALMALFGGRAALVTAQEEPPHPAHIHAGTCDTLDPNPLAPLSDVSAEFQMDGEATASMMMGSGSANAVEGSTTTVPLTLDAILAADHAINVHASAEDVGTYIACGAVSGVMVGNALVIGIGEQNDSGHTGVAILTPDGENTVVAVYLTHAVADEGAAASPAAAAGDGVAMDIAEFAFAQPELTIPAGTTVTWTNQDSAPHTVTADDGSFTSETMNEGDIYSYTFDMPGTYAYVCAFHPSMTATVIVE